MRTFLFFLTERKLIESSSSQSSHKVADRRQKSQHDRIIKVTGARGRPRMMISMILVLENREFITGFLENQANSRLFGAL